MVVAVVAEMVVVVMVRVSGGVGRAAAAGVQGAVAGQL